MHERVELEGVREYHEGFAPELRMRELSGWDREKLNLHEQKVGDRRLVLWLFNEGGHNSVCMDMLDLLHWLRDVGGIPITEQDEDRFIQKFDNTDDLPEWERPSRGTHA